MGKATKVHFYLYSNFQRAARFADLIRKPHYSYVGIEAKCALREQRYFRARLELGPLWEQLARTRWPID